MIENAISSAVNVRNNKVEGSAFTDAIYILNSFTEGKTIEEISKEFGHSILTIQSWLNYLTRIRWLEKIDGKWGATQEGKRWIEISQCINQ